MNEKKLTDIIIENVNYCLKAKGMSIFTLSQQLGVHYQNVYRNLGKSGTAKTISSDVIETYAKALNIPAHLLLVPDYGKNLYEQSK